MNSVETPAKTKAEQFDEMLQSYGDMAYRMALHLTGGKEFEARDLVQEGFLRIWRYWDVRKPESFRGWMYRILHNLYMDALRKKSREASLSLDAEIVEGASWEQTLADHEMPIPARMEQKELQEHVANAVNQLPIEFRIPIVLCDMEGLSYDEIATALAIPVGTVRSRIHRGRCHLRRALVHLQAKGVLP